VQKLISLNLNFLSEPNRVITTEYILCFNFFNHKDVSCDWALLDLARVDAVTLIDIGLLYTNVNYEMPVHLLVTEHQGVT